MLVKATYLLGKEDEPELLEKMAKGLQECVEKDSNSLILTTDDDEFIGSAVKVYVEEDHVTVEYECKEEFKDILIKEGFIV